MNIRHLVRPGQSAESDGNLTAKFFLNGKEITEEEFKKMELLDRNGIASGKKLMIRVEKESINKLIGEN